MLKRPPFGAAFAATVGLPALLAGLSILAFSETDHRYGWALVIAGAIVISAGALVAAALCGAAPQAPTQSLNAQTGGVANVGTAASSAQTGGQTANVIYNINQRVENPPPVPVLGFGDPRPSRETIYDAKGRPLLTVTLYRVTVTNSVQGTKAINVTIQLAKSVPELPVLPVDLHKFHDDDPPYTRSHEVRYGLPIILDVFAKATDADEFFLWRSDLPLGYAYVYHLSPAEKNAIIASLRREGLIMTLSAVPDLPAKPQEQSYKIFIDAEDNLAMERMPD